VVGRIRFALERLDSPRHSSHVAQLFSLGIKIGLRLELVGLAGEDLSSSIWMSKLSAVSLGSARAGLCGGQVRSLPVGERFDLPDFIMDFTSLMPNQSPEPTRIGAVCFAQEFSVYHAAGSGWLSFFR
jgi:hypothetical protein